MANTRIGSSFGSGSSFNVPGASQVSPMTDPTFAALFQQILGSVPQQMPSLESLIQGGVNSPLLQAVLGPALARLVPQQQQQQQNLTEAARAAGGLRGSTYGQDMNKLMANQGLQTNDLMGQIISQMLSTLVGGQLQEQQNSMLPAQTLTNLLRTIAPTTVGGGSASAGSSSGWENISPSLGLQGPTSGGGTLPTLPTYGSTAPTPSIGAPSGFGASASPQYFDPFMGGFGGTGGGWYDIGGGQQWLQPQGMVDPFAHTVSNVRDAEDPFEGWY